jgi:glutamate-1-semialdehyde 2,1-aminomutase/spore coat polysaccharide biosynthesis protein SpsF
MTLTFSQTYSKMSERFGDDGPQYAVSGEGCFLTDDQGTEWLDYTSALGPIILGYRDPDVNDAIIKQLEYGGITFSLPTALEHELAQKLVDIIPCAESVRFGKNGADATAAAVRLARAWTGRNDIIRRGYHGYQDWCIENGKGVPFQYTSALPSHYTGTMDADLEYLASRLKHGGVAAVIMEPVISQNPVMPEPGYLQAVKDLCHEHGALLIFDEVITGFRISLGGAQEYFGVTPDLACFGKAVSNGMPLSAVVGREDIMAQFESGVFFSTTFGGECLSLAAAIATVDKLERTSALEQIAAFGSRLMSFADECAKEHGLQDEVDIIGYPARPFFRWKDPKKARSFQNTMLQQQVLFQGYFNLNLSHVEQDAWPEKGSARQGSAGVEGRVRTGMAG